MPFASKTHAALISALVLLGAIALDSASGVGMLMPTAAQAADNVIAEDISFDGEGMSLEIPRAIFNGTSLTETELAAIFDEDSKKPLAERLSALTAASIIIPELTYTQESGDTTQTTTYYNIELSNVTKGMIEKAISARSVVSTTIDKEDEEIEVFSGSSGQSIIEAIDAIFLARLFTEADASENQKPQQIHGPSSVSDYRFASTPDEGDTDISFAVSIEGIKSKGLSARLGSKPLTGILDRLDIPDGDFEKLSAAKKRAVLTGFADLLSSFDIGETTASNIVVTDGKGDASKSKFAVRIGSIILGYNNQQLMWAFNDISFTGKEEKGKDSAASIKRFSVEDVSFKATIAALIEASKAEPEKDKTPPDVARFAPTGGRLAIAGVDVDVAMDSQPVDAAAKDDKAKDSTDAGITSLVPGVPDRLTFSMKAFDTTMGSEVSNGIARFQTTLTDLRLPISAMAKIDGLKELRDMGYSELTLSSAFKGQWDEAKKQITIDTLSFAGQDIGSVSASARIGGVNLESYGDFASMFSALEQSSLHEFSLTLENGGLFERLVKQQSKAGAGTEDEIKQQYAALATIGIPAVIGESATARKIATAVSRFATSPRKLAITATAKDPKGVPVKSLDFGNAEPGSLLEHFDITTAE